MNTRIRRRCKKEGPTAWFKGVCHLPAPRLGADVIGAMLGTTETDWRITGKGSFIRKSFAKRA